MWASIKKHKTLCILGTTTAISGGYVWYDKRIHIYFEGGFRFIRTSYYIMNTMNLYRKLAKSKDSMDENEYRLARLECHRNGAEYLRTLCLLNQGSFIKLGQHLASLEVALPKEYTDAFKSFQDKAPFHSIKETRTIIKQEFGKEIEELYDQFVYEPIASASIAQVHVAYVQNQKVAVKVQHPTVYRLFDSDLFAMTLFTKLAERYFDFTLGWVLPEFREIVKSELNFLNEANNSEKFKRMFQDNPLINSPQIYWNYTSKRVLTMEYIDGCKIDDLDALEKMGCSKRMVCQLLTDCYAVQTFLFGFIHSDCHPGNLMMIKKNGLHKLVVLDHGCYQTLDEQTRLDYANLWKALFFRDMDNLGKYAKRFGIEEKYADFLGIIMTLSDFFNDKTGFVDERKNLNKNDTAAYKVALKKRWKELDLPENSDIWELVQKMFENGKRELILLLRVNSLLQNIHRTLQKPMNRYEVMAKYAIIGLQRETHEEIRRGLKMKTLKEISFFDKITIFFSIMYFRAYTLLAKAVMRFYSFY